MTDINGMTFFHSAWHFVRGVNTVKNQWILNTLTCWAGNS